MSESLVTRVDEYTRKYFKVSTKEFIEQGLKKGRHYFYLRDSLDLDDKDFKSIVCLIGINLKDVEATKEDYYNIFKEPEVKEEVQDEAY
jgi:hypothetical protein